MRCYAVFVLFALSNWLPAQAPSDVRVRIEMLTADVRDLTRRYDVPMSSERAKRLCSRFEQEQHELSALDFAALDRAARVDLLLLENHVQRELAHLADERRRDDESARVAALRGPNHRARRKPPGPRGRCAARCRGRG